MQASTMPSSVNLLIGNLEKRHGSAMTTMEMKKIDDNSRGSDAMSIK
jgi:hypothetical protein